MARTPIHPGEILRDELDELGMSTRTLASNLDMLANRLYPVLAGRRSLTANMALRLARYFGTSPNFWMNLQTTYELDVAQQEDKIKPDHIPCRKP